MHQAKEECGGHESINTMYFPPERRIAA